MDRLTARFAAASVPSLGLAVLCLICGCVVSAPPSGSKDAGPDGAAPSTTPAVAVPAAASPEEALDQAITTLAAGIRRFAGGSRRVAVMPMQRLGGGVPELGQFLADKLTNRLFAEGQGFSVVDRFHLEDAMREIHMGYTFVQDPQSAQRIGQVLGADAIVVGTLTKLDPSIDINLRLLNTETLDVLGTAEARLPVNRMTSRLWATDLRIEPPALATASSASATASCGLPPPAGCFYYEDFSGVPKGEIPAGWTGGDGMVVIPGTDGKPELTSVETRDPFFVQTCSLSGLSGDFDLEVKVWWDSGDLWIKVGDLPVRLRDTGEVSAGHTVGGVARPLDNSLHTVLIQRRGHVAVVLLDGDEAVVARPGRMNFSPSRITFTTAEMDRPARHFGIGGIRACPAQP
jgi:hypothetical protein